MKPFRYYLQYRGKMFRAFNLSLTKEGVLVVERRFPEKNADLSRARGVRYLYSKEKFTPTWKDEVEHLGAVTIPLDQLAPCKEDEADHKRTIVLDERKDLITVHLFLIKQGQKQDFVKYDMTTMGKKLFSYIETEAYPNIGVILTCS